MRENIDLSETAVIPIRTRTKGVRSIEEHDATSSLPPAHRGHANLDTQELINRSSHRGRRTSELQNLIDFKLGLVKDDGVEKMELLIVKGDFHFGRAEDLKHEFNLEYFRNFRKALAAYQSAHAIQRNNTTIIIGIVRCYIKLHQMKAAVNFLNQIYKLYKPALDKVGDFWINYAIALRTCTRVWDDTTSHHLGTFSRARVCLEVAETLCPNDRRIDRETRIVNNLEDLHSKYKKYKIFSQESKENTRFYENTTRSYSTKELFKILSLDSCGLRAVIPTIVLCEIEKRCNRYLCNVFDMFTGSSAGSIIASALVAPWNLNSRIPIVSCPQAIEMCSEIGKIIYPNPGSVRKLFAGNAEDNKYQFLKGIYGERNVSESLSDLVLPAVYSSGALRTEFFTRSEARSNVERDFSYVDLLMATTSTPSFYQPHYIEGVGYFMDASITTSNPSKNAYEEAVNRLNKTDAEIYVLSLGAGQNSGNTYSQDVSAAKGIMYWASSLPTFMMSGETNNADIFMNEKLGDRYKRWQMYFESDLDWDNYSYFSDMVELGTQFVEEQSDEINKVVEVLMQN